MDVAMGKVCFLGLVFFLSLIIRILPDHSFNFALQGLAWPVSDSNVPFQLHSKDDVYLD